MERDLSQFIQIIRRIPLFEGLKPDQALTVLKACEQKSFEARKVICKFGDASNDMLILLSGQLSVRTEEGAQVAIIKPISPVGEMGIFTEEPRSATVLTREASAGLVLSKIKIQSLMRHNPELEIAISRNLIQILSERIRTANGELAYLNRVIADQGAEPEDLIDTP